MVRRCHTLAFRLPPLPPRLDTGVPVRDRWCMGRFEVRSLFGVAAIVAAVVVVVLSTAVGCASDPGRSKDREAAISKDKDKAAATAPTHEPVFFHGASGRQAGWDEIVNRAWRADVVIIGETHGHETGLRTAAELWDAIIERAGSASVSRRPALAMEFFERDQQLAIDDYLAGLIDEATFRQRANKSSESGYPDGHRRMVESAKSAGLRVIAANAPRRYVTLSRTRGFDAVQELSAEQRRMVSVPLAEPSLSYRERFFDVMRPMFMGGGGHAAGGADQAQPDMADVDRRVSAFYRAQTVWDATMAESVVSALSDGDRPVVLVVGRFHSDFEGGTAELIRRRWPVADIVTLSFAGREGEELSGEDIGRATFVVYAGDR